MTSSEWEWAGGQHEVGIHVATFVPPASDGGFVSRLLSGLRQAVPDFVPETFQIALLDRGTRDIQAGPSRPLSEDTLPDFYKSLRVSQIGSGNLNRGSPPAVTFTLSSLHEDQGPFKVPYDLCGLSCQRKIVSSPQGRRKFLRAAQILLECSQGFFGDLGTVSLVKMAPPDDTGGRQVIPLRLELGLPPPRWGFLLAPDYVALLGPNRLRRAPCEVVQEPSGGLFLLLLAEDFRILEKDESLLEERRQRLVDHLGPEHFSYTQKGFPKRVLPQFTQSRTRSGADAS